jgi:hypothetical protein
MTRFVRAMAIDERLLLGARAIRGDPSISLIDDARRRSICMILLSDRTQDELSLDDVELPAHFDAVVAESGATISVGGGPATRMPMAARRPALLSVLMQLNVDPHDALGISTGTGQDLLDLEWCLTTVEGEGDMALAAAGADGLERVLAGLTSWAAFSPPRHEVRLDRVGSHARGLDIVVPSGHVNVLLCAADRDVRDVPLQLAQRWSHAGYQTVVLDVDGGSARWSAAWAAEGLEPGDRLDLNDVHIDASATAWSEQLQSALRIHPQLVTLTVSDLAGTARTNALATALTCMRTQRLATGRPHWLLIDSAESVLEDTGLAPHVLDLRDRGHCLVLRRHAPSPPWLGNIDVVQPCSPNCPLRPKRPSRAVHPRDPQRDQLRTVRPADQPPAITAGAGHLPVGHADPPGGGPDVARHPTPGVRP